MNANPIVTWGASTTQLGPLEAIIIAPNNVPPSHLAVLCHGYGAPGDDLVGLADWLIRRFEGTPCRPALVFPAAPIDLEPEGLPDGRAWWYLNMARLMQLTMAGSFDELRRETPPGLDAARQSLTEAVAAAFQLFENTELPLILGGFSQGAMLAIDTAIRGLPQPPQILVAFSGALICEDEWTAGIQRLSNTTILQTHGHQDTILPFATGQWLGELLKKSGSPHYQMVPFDGGHGIPPSALEALLKQIHV